MGDSEGDALRRAGFRRTQKLWLKEENFDLVMWIAHQDKIEVERIVNEFRNNQPYRK